MVQTASATGQCIECPQGSTLKGLKGLNCYKTYNTARSDDAHTNGYSTRSSATSAAKDDRGGQAAANQD